MYPPRARLPESLFRSFFRVDDPLLVARYRAGLEACVGRKTHLDVFHLDRAGYSPEVAEELGDPFYLGARALEGHAIILSVAQLAAPLVHPGLGFAAEPLISKLAEARPEISQITLREPLLADVRQTRGSLAKVHELADVGRFELRFRTPEGLIGGRQRLESMKQEFLASDRLWLDDAYIHELGELARRMKDVGPIAGTFRSSEHKLNLFYTPAFLGTYVVDEGVSRRTATTYVLSRDCPTGAPYRNERSSTRGRKLVLEPLTERSAAVRLQELTIARFDLGVLRNDPDRIAEARTWLGAQQRLREDPDRPLESSTPDRLPAAPDNPSDELRELEELAHRLSDRGSKPPKFASLTPGNQLRLLSATSARPPVRRFVRHLQAFLDEDNLEGVWHNAPDVFFARLPELSDASLRFLAERVAEAPGA